MASPSRKTKLIRKRKKTKMGKSRKRKLRKEGSTADLKDILGPIKKEK